MQSATIFFALAAVVAAAYASPIGDDAHAYPAYQTSYAVSDKHTGDQKSASEVRDGGVTKGSYSLVQPDGVVRTVVYTVTPHGGFQAHVINKGVAAHPTGGWGASLGGHGGLAHGGASSTVQGLGVPVAAHGHGNAGLGYGAGIY